MKLEKLTPWLGGAALAALVAGLVAGGAPARADPITLHALMEDVPESQIIEAMLPEFEKETGIKVQFQRLVYSEMHDKLVTQLTGQSSYYNVLEVDFLWAGEFPEAGWLADLQPFVDKSGFDLFEDGICLGGGVTKRGGVLQPRIPTVGAAEAFVLARHLETLVTIGKAVESSRSERGSSDERG